MNKNFVKHFSPFFFVKVLAMVQKKKKRKEKGGKVSIWIFTIIIEWF